MNYTKDTFRQIFQQPFNQNQWQEVLRDFFHATVLRAEPEHIDGTSEEEQGFYLGAIDTDDSYRIGLFHFNIKHGDVSRKRVGLRNLVRSFVNPTWGEFDAALVVFHSHESWRLSFICDIKGEATAPKRYTFVFGDANNWYNTAVGRFMDLKDKGVNFANIKEAFSVEALTKEFYNKLYNWFLWAKDKHSGVTFPNKIDTDVDDRNKMEVKIIRLITRMLFVWFIKQKHLVPNNLFEADFLATVLRDFDPESTNNGNYYNAILQNLFFATLNQEIDGRKLLTTYKNRSPYYSNKQLYRDTDKSYFTYPLEEREQHIIDLFKDIPYLNGGLFECLDKYELDEDGEKIVQVTNYDGFSHENTKSPNGNFKKKAFIPNALFFATEHHETVTIKEATTDKPEETQTITVMGLVELFKQYNFTVEENTTSDVEVSLDPELLGRVFENLLAAYNPETQDSARKSTGSYYTPREIVDYMVEESLIAYLSGECGHDEKEMRSLIKGDSAVIVSDADKVIDDLKNIKVLDPACGSGAFPMGVLLKITDIIERLQPNGFSRYQTKLDIIKKCIYGIDIQPIAMLICKLRFFISLICDSEKDPSKPNFGIIPLPNLETKFVAANSLLPAKLRQFDNDVFVDEHLRQLQEDLLALRQGIFDLRTHAAKLNNKRRDREKCREIKAYIRQNATQPNKQKLTLLEKQIADCEAKLPLYEGECWVEEMTTTQTSLFEEPQPTLFRKDVNKEKREKLQAQIRSAKAEIEKEQSKKALPEFEEAVDEVTEWDPYNQNAVAPFFDAEWMFGIGIDKSSGEDNRPSKQGFSVIIGNPPYVEAKKLKSQSADLKKNFSIYTGTADLSIYFVELGLRNCHSKGNVCFITTNKFFNTEFGKPLRKLILNNTITQLINFEQVEVFEGVLVSSVIIGIKPQPSDENQFPFHQFYRLNNAQFKKEFVAKQNIFGAFNQVLLDESEWSFSTGEKAALRHKLESFTKVKEIKGVHVYRGVTTGYNPAFIITNQQRDQLIQADPNNAKIIKNMLQGRNIRKWYYNESEENLLQTGFDTNIEKNYPLIYRWLLQFKKELEVRADQGKEWYNLRACKYYGDFEKSEKIIWGLTADKWAYAFDSEQHYLPSNGYIMTSETLPIRFLLGLLNSKVLHHYFGYIGIMTAGGAYTLKAATIEAMPIPPSTEKQQADIIKLVNTILTKKNKDQQADVSGEEYQIDQLVYKLYELTEDEIKIVEEP